MVITFDLIELNHLIQMCFCVCVCVKPDYIQHLNVIWLIKLTLRKEKLFFDKLNQTCLNYICLGLVSSFSLRLKQLCVRCLCVSPVCCL